MHGNVHIPCSLVLNHTYALSNTFTPKIKGKGKIMLQMSCCTVSCLGVCAHISMRIKYVCV